MKKKFLILGVSTFALMTGVTANAHPLLKEREAAQEEVARFTAARTIFAQMEGLKEGPLAAQHASFAQRLEEYGTLLSEQVPQEGGDVPPKATLQLHQSYLQDIAAFLRGYEDWKGHERATFCTSYQGQAQAVFARMEGDVEAVEQLMILTGRAPLHHLLKVWADELSQVTQLPVEAGHTHSFWLATELQHLQTARASEEEQRLQDSARIEEELAVARAQLASFTALDLGAEAIKALREKATQLESDLAAVQTEKAATAEAHTKAVVELEQQLATARAQLAPFTALDLDAEAIKALHTKVAKLESDLATAQKEKAAADEEQLKVIGRLEPQLAEIQAAADEASDGTLFGERGQDPVTVIQKLCEEIQRLKGLESREAAAEVSDETPQLPPSSASVAYTTA